MSSEKATAIVLRVIEFSETSSVVTLFTREFGKVRGLAKGARRPKGPFESALDLLALCRIVFLRKSSDSLDLLTEAKLERRFRPAGGNLSKLYAAYYVAELLNELTDDYDPHPGLFDAADATLVSFASAGEDVASALVHFELTALRETGHLPTLAACAACGRDVEATGRVPFSQRAGGVLCKSCRSGQKQIISVSSSVIAALARMAGEDRPSSSGGGLDARTYGELRGVLNHYWTHLMGRPARMQRWLPTPVDGTSRTD
ncbi:MAG: DNA repair protein RecO [Planctomycetota bacterium]|nr:MAG: DNA repair protein RecO [Planctomycetota bacterium]